MKGNAIIGQSGGPTAVINSSLAGVIDAVAASGGAGRLYGLVFGIEGLLEERFIDLTAQRPETVRGLRNTPSSALGSSRHKVRDEDLPKILSILKKHDIRYFFLIGGNDTMDTICRVERYCREQRYELIGVGIPKTVDNDLFGTDHTPGFASAARSNVLNVMQAGVLARDMRKVDKFVVYQTVGRDAGWLAAATALARRGEDDAPHLIYMPERAFDRERFLADVQEAEARYGWVSVVCGEGIRYADGTPVSATRLKDKFGNAEFGASGGASAALALHGMINGEFGWRGEFQIPESLVMSDFSRAVPVDLEEAYRCGLHAVALAERGESGSMVSLERLGNDPYRADCGKVPLSDVAVRARPLPDEFIDAEANYPTGQFLDYCRPLVGDLPRFVRLEANYA